MLHAFIQLPKIRSRPRTPMTLLTHLLPNCLFLSQPTTSSVLLEDDLARTAKDTIGFWFFGGNWDISTTRTIKLTT
jgi:hypothetical protein